MMLIRLACLLIALQARSSSAETCDILSHDLTVEHLGGKDRATLDPDSPLSPRFSWRGSSASTPSPEAAASRVQVTRSAIDPSKGLLWDSGWLLLGRSNGLDVVRSEGQLPGLREFERLFWRAQFAVNTTVGDLTGESNGLDACGWSAFQTVTVGPSQATWRKAHWLCPRNQTAKADCEMYDTTGKVSAPLFRTSFTLPPRAAAGRNGKRRKVASAVLFASGLGHYEAWLNGRHINAGRFLDPAPASYGSRVYFNEFDVTDSIANASGSSVVLGLVAGNGWFNPLPLKFWGSKNIRDALVVGPPRVICVLAVTFTDDPEGSSPFIVMSDAASWLSAPSGLLRNDLYLGNIVDVDRVRELSGWSSPEFAASGWHSAVQCASDSQLNDSLLQPQPTPPIRARPPYLLRPVSRSVLPDSGALVFDFGLNTAAAVQLQLTRSTSTGAAVEIELRFGEILWPNGSVNVLTSTAGQIKSGNGGPCSPSVAYQRAVFRSNASSLISSSSAPFTFNFTTQFSWHGFRYAQVLLPPGWAIDIAAIPLMTDLAHTSEFNSSSAQLDRILAMAKNTHASNMMGIQSDCPHRERFGYTGDALATLQTSMHIFDGSAFYEKRLFDVADSQRASGGVTETAPYVGISDAGLGDGSGPVGWDTLFPVLQVELRRFFANTRALGTLQNSTRRWITFLVAKSETCQGLGDWMATDPTPVPLSGHAFLVDNLRTWAALAPSEAEAKAFLDKAAAAVQEFGKRFVNASTGDVTVDGSHPTQTGQSMALFNDLVAPAMRSKVLSSLLRTVAKSNNHITSGMFGIRWLLETLSANNASDLAWQMVMQEDYPSYGYMLNSGATTLWESWFFSNNTFSHNHPMFSGVVPWAFGTIGGIRIDDDAVGADRLTFSPSPPVGSGLKYAAFQLRLQRGTAACSWRCTEHGVITVNITCPVNTHATVLIPGMEAPVSITGGEYQYESPTPLCVTARQTPHVRID